MKTLNKSAPYIIGTLAALFIYEVLDEIDAVDGLKRNVMRMLG